jgi:hypothetical protein
MKPILLGIKPSDREDKKYEAQFDIGNDHLKIVHFGQKGAMDYIKYSKKDKKLADIRKRLYINRHSDKEDWTDYMSAGALSRFILWNLPDFYDSVHDYKRRFNL